MKKSNNVCRCCLTKGCSKNLDDELENYGEMLIKTFNLTLDVCKKLICEDCVARLQDAATFKQQIMDADITLKRLNSENKELFLKSDGSNYGFSCEAWQSETITEEDAVSDVKLEPVLLITEDKICSKDKDNRLKDVLDIKNHITKKNTCKKTEKLKDSSEYLEMKANHENEDEKNQRENSIKLITNSNICLFKSLRTRFACYVCNEKYFEIKDLRIHSKNHSKDDFERRIKRLRGKSYENADITNLSCTICWEGCASLDILRNHLNKNHNIIFGDSNLLIPYKLEEGFKCQVCKDSFNTFTRLSIHMNTHATSNVCETCGMAFYNRISLRNHIRSIHREQKCSQCTLKFPSTTKLVRHKQKVHNAALAKHYCLKCNMTFRYPYLLKSHMVEKHGGKHVSVECSSCGKVFKNGNGLKTHFRSVHLNERNFLCSFCELRFFTRADRTRHERIHKGDSLFTCDLCETKFKSKDSMRRHMKRQHGTVNDKNG